jgi:uncharacterized protein YbaP (TraB family)
MKKIIISLFFVSVIFSVFSQNKFDNALLWKVSGKDLSNPSYIFGTHHLIYETFIDSISGFQEALSHTEQVVGELVIKDGDENKVAIAAIMPQGKSYKEILSAGNYRKLDEMLITNMGAGLEALAQYKPGMINNLYTLRLYTSLDSSYNIMAHIPIDLHIQNLGAAQGKTVIGLETIEDQIFVLFEMEPLEDQVNSLLCMLENPEWNMQILKDMTSFYKQQALGKLYDLVYNNEEDPCPVSENRISILNDGRNNKWMKRLPTIMKEKPSFIAVGALHLVGENGLLNQLQNLGYIIEPVN